MPGKFSMVLIVLVIVGAVYGSTLLPPDAPTKATKVPPVFALIAGERPARQPAGPAGGAEDPADLGGGVPPPDDDEPVEVRITDLELTRVQADYTVPVEDTGGGEFVIVRIDAEGALRWGGMPAGAYDVIEDLFRKNHAIYKDEFVAVVAADRRAPWQYLYWTLEAAREAGLTKVLLGVTPGTDEEGTLLAGLEQKLPQGEITLPEDMVELEVVVVPGEGEGEDALPTYTVFDQEVSDRQSLFNKCGSFNYEYADEYGANYARDASKTPWVVIAPPLTSSGYVLKTVEALRLAAIYTVRFGGEFPPRPGKKR